MADTQRTAARRVPSVEFRSTFGKLEEPVDVTVLGRVIGHWYPAGYPVAWGQPPAAPTSRSAPVIPSGSLVVGTAETDRAQSGTSDNDTPRGQASHEPGGVMHTAPLGSSPLAIIPPKPAGYVHDPSFNSKGSRPAPKTRSGK